MIVIARNKATKQSRTEIDSALDCFAEPVIGPATAGRTRWLAMTQNSGGALVHPEIIYLALLATLHEILPELAVAGAACSEGTI